MIGRAAQLELEPRIYAVLDYVVGRLRENRKRQRDVSGNRVRYVAVGEMNFHFLLLEIRKNSQKRERPRSRLRKESCESGWTSLEISNVVCEDLLYVWELLRRAEDPLALFRARLAAGPALISVVEVSGKTASLLLLSSMSRR